MVEFIYPGYISSHPNQIILISWSWHKTNSEVRLVLLIYKVAQIIKKNQQQFNKIIAVSKRDKEMDIHMNMTFSTKQLTEYEREWTHAVRLQQESRTG